MTYTLKADDTYIYTRDANALVGPYITNIPLAVSAVSDGEVSAAGTLPTLSLPAFPCVMGAWFYKMPTALNCWPYRYPLRRNIGVAVITLSIRMTVAPRSLLPASV